MTSKGTKIRGGFKCNNYVGKWYTTSEDKESQIREINKEQLRRGVQECSCDECKFFS